MIPTESTYTIEGWVVAEFKQVIERHLISDLNVALTGQERRRNAEEKLTRKGMRHEINEKRTNNVRSNLQTVMFFLILG